MSGSHVKWLSGILVVCAPWSVLADPTGYSASPTNIFAPASTPGAIDLRTVTIRSDDPRRHIHRCIQFACLLSSEVQR